MTTIRLKIVGTIALLAIMATVGIAGVTGGAWFLWTSINAAPPLTITPSPTTPSPIPTATDTATATSTMTPTSTATATPIATPTDTATATPTDTATATATTPPSPTHTPTPTDTPAATHTPPPVPTATVRPTRPPARPTPTATVPLPAPSLIAPADEVQLDDKQRFTWQWSGPALEEDQAFDLRIWSEQEDKTDQPKRGAVAPTQDLEVEVDLQYVPAINDYGLGAYYWTVVVVQVSSDAPPKVVGEWGEKRRFTINGSPDPKPTLDPTPTRIQP